MNPVVTKTFSVPISFKKANFDELRAIAKGLKPALYDFATNTLTLKDQANPNHANTKVIAGTSSE